MKGFLKCLWLGIFVSLVPWTMAQDFITVDPVPTSTGSPSPTSTPQAGVKVNCTALTSCNDCVKSADCGWCSVNTPQCITAFNLITPQGSGLNVCYGQMEQYFWMQCQMGSRSVLIVLIAVGIIVGLVLIFIVGCLVRMRRKQSANEGGSFTRMVDGFEKKYGQKNEIKKSNKASTEKEIELSPRSPSRFKFG